MNDLGRYRKRSGATVTAVQLDLDTEGFRYRKWGSVQVCKPGDWLVNNDGDVYSVDREVFENTYSAVSPGVYLKTKSVWARIAEAPGEIETREGVTHYLEGDYLVFNDPDGDDGYAVAAEKFGAMYEPVEPAEGSGSV